MSQIERGLREPSEKVLDAIARNLDLSAEALYEQAGMSASSEEDEEPAVGVAIREDPRLNASQREALLEVYDAFVGAAPPAPPRQGRRRRRGLSGSGLDRCASQSARSGQISLRARSRHQADVAAGAVEVGDVLAAHQVEERQHVGPGCDVVGAGG
jgi:transcriptional regulator with XRE-family HTH domain